MNRSRSAFRRVGARSALRFPLRGSPCETDQLYEAILLDVVDGNTIDLLVDLGSNTRHEIRVRISHLDTTKIRGVHESSEEYQQGSNSASSSRVTLRARSCSSIGLRRITIDGRTVSGEDAPPGIRSTWYGIPARVAL